MGVTFYFTCWHVVFSLVEFPICLSVPHTRLTTVLWKSLTSEISLHILFSNPHLRLIGLYLLSIHRQLSAPSIKMITDLLISLCVLRSFTEEKLVSCGDPCRRKNIKNLHREWESPWKGGLCFMH